MARKCPGQVDAPEEGSPRAVCALVVLSLSPLSFLTLDAVLKAAPKVCELTAGTEGRRMIGFLSGIFASDGRETRLGDLTLPPFASEEASLVDTQKKPVSHLGQVATVNHSLPYFLFSKMLRPETSFIPNSIERD